MKKLILISSMFLLVFTACETSKLVSYADDVYSTPFADKEKARLAKEAKLQQEITQKQKAEEAALAQKALDDANPYYQDPQYSDDDYYDYAYASRIRRFNNPINGAGYYDNYYTNSYYYNANPYLYGQSIYNSYGWCSPNYYSGSSIGFTYGNPYNYYPYYGGNNSFNIGYSLGYNNGYNNGYNGFGYNPYYGYSPYYYSNPYNNGWGYLNSFDVNSQYKNMTFAARGSNGGGNSGRMTSAGMAIPSNLGGRERVAFFESVVKKQEETPRFTQTARPVKNNSGISSGNSITEQPIRNSGYNSGLNGRTEDVNLNSSNQNIGNTGRTVKQNNDVEIKNTNTRTNSRNGRVSGETNQSENNNGSNNANRSGNWNSNPSPSPSPSPSPGRTSTPRSSSSGTSRPR
ncbi:MAG: cell envelope integrity protein TolA [Sphingobacteriaceae bacterium]|nr:cell envelope integrity protein TolA [Sphingobacteriaceae bacterium]